MKKAEENKNHSYFYSLDLEGINCFKDKQILNLSDDEGNYSPWTIILGDNGTGKTTLLKVLDRMQPIEAEHEKVIISKPLLVIEFILKNTKIDDSNAKLYLKNDSETFLAIQMKDGKANIIGHTKTSSFLISYGASRRMSKNPNLSQTLSNLQLTSLFDESIELINVEEWYLQKYLAFQTSENEIKKQFETQLEIIKNILVDFLPDVIDLRIKEVKSINEKSALEVKINAEDWINLRDLSFGYQTTTALLVDIASKMMEQYPESNNPLAEPVIILIDEIDLHLHPKWQRTVIDKFSQHFPQAQFIVTAHSPLIVQAAQDRNANIVVCRKEGDRVIIDNDSESVKGWRIDQILTSDLFEVESTQSVKMDEIRNEKINILLKEKLSSTDKKRLNFLDGKLNNNPIYSTKESINAEELIKKAAELLKK